MEAEWKGDDTRVSHVFHQKHATSTTEGTPGYLLIRPPCRAVYYANAWKSGGCVNASYRKKALAAVIVSEHRQRSVIFYFLSLESRGGSLESLTK